MEKIPRPLLGEGVIFYDYVLRGLSFPLHAFFRAMLVAYGLQLHDLPPNSYLHVACFITLCECFLGVNPQWGLWKRIFMVKRQKPNVVGCINFQVKPEVRYFSLQQRESMQHWRSKWFYVRDDSVGKANKKLPAFTIKGSVKKMVAAEADSLISRIHALMNQGLTGIHLIALFLKMRIQPLQARTHPMWSYMPTDPTQVNAEELTPEEVEERVARLTSSSVSSSASLDSPVVPYGLARPREEGLEDPFSQPPLTAQTESSDEVSESPTQVADPEVEEVSMKPQRKRNRESNPAGGDDKSTGANSLKDAAELQCKTWEQKHADLYKELADRKAAEDRLVREVTDALVAQRLEQEGRWVEQLNGAARAITLNAKAKEKLQEASKVLAGLIRNMFPDEPVPESLGGLIEFFKLATILATRLDSVDTGRAATGPDATPAEDQEVGDA
ncbi:hypothetical protein BRADI_5g09553v3 [Brachypodium distachyon]|uniref:Transposase (putative) gypsy type domain-containing protein n=1 Tax=Brachypodium distachyon TaxID=15368 RepID=A0A0Q3E870_BRADI|nr:hypothetical protein BRADI_5g09553v3 [Brachypodium distachyon]